MYNAAGQINKDQLVQRFAPLVKRIAYHLMARLPSSVQVDDLVQNGMLGLLDAINILNGVEGIHFCHFEDCDVVRHMLVQRIVRAYESYKSQQQELPLSAGEEPRLTE